MKNFIAVSIVKASICALAFASILPTPSTAAEISINSGPTTNVSGAVSEDPNSNSVIFTNVSPTLTKISGDAAFTSSGGDGSVTVEVAGLLSAEIDDEFTLDYDFTVDFTGGAVSYVLTGYVDPIGLGFTEQEAFSENGSLSSGVPKQGQGGYTNTLFDVQDVSWRAVLQVSWTGAANLDTLTLTIPTNSIDFAVVPVPEPSSLVLAFFAALFLARRRRR